MTIRPSVLHGHMPIPVVWPANVSLQGRFATTMAALVNFSADERLSADEGQLILEAHNLVRDAWLSVHARTPRAPENSAA